MDSKVLIKTFFVVLLALLAVFAAVALMNGDMLKRRFFSSEEKEAPVRENVKTLERETEFGLQLGDQLRAFESDPGFFDKELNSAELLLSESGRQRIDLILTSVEKDIRIQIVDAVGKPVKGSSFFVTLLRSGDTEPIGQYKDLDKDGVIYVADLNPGSYQAYLSPMEEYEVPEVPGTIQVKARVEYSPITDIALLIRSEDEIDAEIEDTEQREPEEQEAAAPSEVEFPGGRGIDVSKYQKDIDWERVRASGITFAILRCGYRGSKTGCLVEDPYFRTNLKGAKEAGVELGLYFFTQAVNDVEAVEEASMALALLGEEKLSYPIYIDTEGAGGNGRADGLDARVRTDVCKAFCKTVEAAGYRAGIYASRNWWNNNLNRQELEDYETWLAEYTDEPKYDGYFSMWQYTSKGRVDGITGNVDMDLALERRAERDEVTQEGDVTAEGNVTEEEEVTGDDVVTPTGAVTAEDTVTPSGGAAPTEPAAETPPAPEQLPAGGQDLEGAI